MDDGIDARPAAARTVRVVIGSTLDDLVAVKTGTNPAAVVAVEREALVLSQLRHPNVVDLLRTEQGDGTATMVTQFAGSHTLADHVHLDAATVASTGADLLTIVAEVHGLGWVHTRLRAEHVIVGAGGRLTLCAWGGAHRAGATDHRRADDLTAVVAIVDGLARRIDADALDRAGRRRLRRLRRVLDDERRDAATPAGAHRLRRRLADLAGTVAVVALPFDDLDDGTTRPATRRPADATTRPRPVEQPARSGRSRRWRGVLASIGILAALFGTVALLRWIGGPLGLPDDDSTIARVGDLPEPVALAISVVRIAAFAACAYGIALTSAALTAILTRRPDIERLATAMAPRALRRAMVALIGLGVLASVAGGPTDAGRPSTTTTSTTTTSTSTTTTTSTPPVATPVVAELPTPPAPAPVPAATPVADADLPDLWVMRPGDHLWRVASIALGMRLDRDATTAEIDRYWRSIIELNRESLVDPENPDLVFVGQVIELPPLD